MARRHDKLASHIGGSHRSHCSHAGGSGSYRARRKISPYPRNESLSAVHPAVLPLAPQLRLMQRPAAFPPIYLRSFPNAKPGKDEAQNVFNIGGSGQRVQRSQRFVEVEQKHLVVHPPSSRLATPLQSPKRFPKKLLVPQV